MIWSTDIPVRDLLSEAPTRTLHVVEARKTCCPQVPLQSGRREGAVIATEFQLLSVRTVVYRARGEISHDTP